METWKDIDGYEGLYQVSDQGRVKSLARKDPMGRSVKEKLCKTSPGNRGYPVVRLCKDGKSKLYLLHRLVADAFIPNLENKPVVNHKNGVKTDCQVENLEWVTSQENCVHAWNTGLRTVTDDFRKKMSELQKGESNTMYGKAPWNYGKSMSEESRMKNSESHKGKRHSEETRKKMSESHKRSYQKIPVPQG